MKIIQQNEKVIAYIGKDDTNEGKIIKMIENVQENGVTDYEVDAENPRLYSEGGLLYYFHWLFSFLFFIFIHTICRFSPVAKHKTPAAGKYICKYNCSSAGKKRSAAFAALQAS